MSTLFKGAEIPPSCLRCFVTTYMCPAIKKRVKEMDTGVWIPSNYRHDDCPLVEVKEPHGRLGDLDELKSKFRHGKGNSDEDSAWISTIRRFITQAETIIEAEGREE